jgi:DNA-binding NtrC family response regulator
LEAQRLAYTNEKIHLLVTDFSMPQTNGLELAHWFQANSPETKVLIATGSLCEFVHQAGEQQRFAVLAKPFDGVQLGRMVRLILDKP